MRKVLVSLLVLGSFSFAAIETTSIENGNVTIIAEDTSEIFFKLDNITKMYSYIDNGKYKYIVSLIKDREDISLQRKENFIKLKEAFFNNRR